MQLRRKVVNAGLFATGLGTGPLIQREPMTAPRTPSPSEHQSLRETIRATGLRATPARIATLWVLRLANSPMTHAELADTLAEQGFDKATAFRNLNDLTEVGLLRRSELGDHVWRFEAIDPDHAGKDAHPHFVCVDCGSVTCMDDIQLTAGSQRKSQAVGEITEILVRGHCNGCR